MFYVYVLYSKSWDRFYIGQTSDVDDRIKRHNGGRSQYTRGGRPWLLIHTEEYSTRSEAIKRELFLKSAEGWKEIQKIKSVFLRDVAQPG